MRLSDLQSKSIITEDGKLIGKIIDININIDGIIQNIVVEKYKFLVSLFSTKDEFIIDWKQIITIGDDAIIIHLDDKKE